MKLIWNFTFACTVVFGGCTNDQPRAGLGSVDLAIVGTGSDGATYQLLAGTRLSLATSLEPNFDISLDGVSSTVTVALPTGDYQATLYNNAVADADHWQLQRSTPGNPTTTVTATLATMQPVSISIVANQSTSLSFQFVLASGGTVDFDRGNLDVTFGVGTQPATRFGASMQGTGNSGAPLIQGPFANALAAIMPGTNATGLSLSVSARLTGGWIETGGTIEPDSFGVSACAPIEIVGVQTIGNDGLAALMAESGHGDSPGFLFGPASLCVVDNGGTGMVRIRMSRLGPAETSTLANIMGTTQAGYLTTILGTLPQRAYDGQAGRLDLDVLSRAHDLPMRTHHQLSPNFSGEVWYSTFLTGQMTFSFTLLP